MPDNCTEMWPPGSPKVGRHTANRKNMGGNSRWYRKNRCTCRRSPRQFLCQRPYDLYLVLHWCVCKRMTQIARVALDSAKVKNIVGGTSPTTLRNGAETVVYYKTPNSLPKRGFGNGTCDEMRRNGAATGRSIHVNSKTVECSHLAASGKNPDRGSRAHLKNTKFATKEGCRKRRL